MNHKLPPDEIIQDWIAYAKRGIPEGEIAMTAPILNAIRVVALGEFLLKSKRMLTASETPPHPSDSEISRP